MKKIFGLLILILGSNIALAENWVSLGTTTDNTQIFIDKASIKDNGKFTNAWIKSDYPNTIPEVTFDGKAVKEARVNWEFLCNTRQFRFTNSIFYYKDNSHASIIIPSSWYKVTPNTAKDTIFHIVCKNQILINNVFINSGDKI